MQNIQKQLGEILDEDLGKRLGYVGTKSCNPVDGTSVVKQNGTRVFCP